MSVMYDIFMMFVCMYVWCKSVRWVCCIYVVIMDEPKTEGREVE